MTDYKKRIIRKLTKEYSEVIAHPQHFKIRKVGKATGSLMRASGYKVVNDRAVLPAVSKYTNKGRVGFESVTVSKNKVVTVYSDRTETVYLSSAKDFLKTIDRLLEREDLGEDDDEGVFWAFKVGDRNTFINSHKSLSLLLFGYGKNLTYRHNDNETKRITNLVKVEYHSRRDFEQGPVPPLEMGRAGKGTPIRVGSSRRH